LSNVPFQLATKLRPTQEALEVVSQSGFRAVEFWTNTDLLSHPDTIARLAEKFDFNYVIHFPNRGELTSEALRHAVELYATLASRAMVIHQPMIERYGRELLAHDPSLRLGVENHRLTLSEFEDWAGNNSWLTLDVEHLWKFTLEDGPLAALLETLESFLSRFAAKLVHVHLPGYLPGYEEHRPMYCSREMVLAVLSLLADCQFDGLVVSEVNSEYQNRYDLEMDVLLGKHFEQLRSQAG